MGVRVAVPVASSLRAEFGVLVGVAVFVGVAVAVFVGVSVKSGVAVRLSKRAARVAGELMVGTAVSRVGVSVGGLGVSVGSSCGKAAKTVAVGSTGKI